MASRVLLVQGGSLIDGTGRPPLENAAILIEKGRFTQIGRAGSFPVPPDAEILDATARTILPGFIDGHGHLEDFHGELYLHLGITSCATIEIFQDGPWTLAQKRGTALGKIKGPRIWSSGRAIGGGRTATDAPSAKTARGNIVVTTVQEAQAAVRRKKELGFELIKLNEFLAFDLVAAVVEEAHRLDLPVTCHSLDVLRSVAAGVDAIEHIWSVGYSSILYPPSRRALAEDRLAGKIEQELAGAYYLPENFDAVIGAMVERGVAWTPTIAKWLRPLSAQADRFRARENQILEAAGVGLPGAVRAVTDNAYDKILKRYTPGQQAQVRKFYDLANEFIRRFHAAGGRLKEGSDPPRGMAALLMHEALAMDVEAGVSPMAAIQAATLNVAQTFRKDRDYGSIEPGKVADLFLVEGDPLTDIWATQNVTAVVMDGAVIDHSLTGYKNPIPSFYAYQTLPNELEILPKSLVAGSGPVRLTVRGQGIWPFHHVYLKREFGSLLQLGATELPTRFVSKSELEAEIAPALIAEPGTYTVTIKAEGEALPESHRAHLIVEFRD